MRKKAEESSHDEKLNPEGKVIAVRLPEEARSEINGLRKRLQGNLPASIEVSHSDAVRLLIHRGIEGKTIELSARTKASIEAFRKKITQELPEGVLHECSLEEAILTLVIRQLRREKK